MSDLQDIRTVPAADVSQRRFHDRVVTGAGDGIGAASTARFADEGAHVIVCDANDTAAVSVADNPTSRGLPAQARVFDVTDADACRALAEQTISEHSRIDVLVNNAGLNRRGDLLSLSDDDWSITSRSTSMRCSTCAARFFPT